MATVTRGVGYTGGVQRLVWSYGTTAVTAYLWGGGGGPGGRDGGGFNFGGDTGGDGTGGGFSRVSFTLNEGDEIRLAVGQAGGSAASGAASAPGGTGGQSLVYDLFNSRGVPGSIPVADRRWGPFMNAHAVWASPYVFEYTYNQNIFFPYTGYYTFTYQADDKVDIYIDNSLTISYGGFRANPPPSSARYITRGTHNIKWIADNRGGDVSGIALRITASWSGGNGSAAGPVPFSGGGGGGGGATVLLLNNVILGIAGGGAGGGGGGRNAGSSPNAPGSGIGRAETGVGAGQNGQSKGGDGGGAGGGGGGYAGGNGGAVSGGDQPGLGGAFGSGLGDSVSNPSGRTPGGISSGFYKNNSRGGIGASLTVAQQTGGNGYAALAFENPDLYVNLNGVWRPTQNIYVRTGSSWRTVDQVYLRTGAGWQASRGSNPPRLSSVSGDWGLGPRTNA